MNKEKIALLVDSGSNVSAEFIKKYNMYVAPLKIIYKEEEYTDGIDIKAEEVYARLQEEIPSTSLPSPGTIQTIFNQIKSDGYNKVLAITISSGLSGTYNTIRMLGEEQEDLQVHVFDTKNISLASGYNAIQAGEYIEAGMNWDDLIQAVSKNIKNSKVFFYVSTLKYLQKGGRIGLVASLLGTRLNLKPIITCNEDGIYYTISKTIGENRALDKMLKLATDYIGDSKEYNLGVLNADAKEKAHEIKESLIKILPDAKIFVEDQISPALGVHTGPGAIGIVVQKL